VRAGVAVPGREAEPNVLLDGADPPARQQLPVRLGRRRRGENALAVRVEDLGPGLQNEIMRILGEDIPCNYPR